MASERELEDKVLELQEKLEAKDSELAEQKSKNALLAEEKEGRKAEEMTKTQLIEEEKKKLEEELAATKSKVKGFESEKTIDGLLKKADETGKALYPDVTADDLRGIDSIEDMEKKAKAVQERINKAVASRGIQTKPGDKQEGYDGIKMNAGQPEGGVTEKAEQIEKQVEEAKKTGDIEGVTGGIMDRVTHKMDQLGIKGRRGPYIKKEEWDKKTS